nr:MAG TPA: hypothetical protein [Caudoviricetes sp.]
MSSCSSETFFRLRTKISPPFCSNKYLKILTPNLQSLSGCVTISVNLLPRKNRPKMVCNPFYSSSYFLSPIISTTSLKGTNIIYSILILQM